MFAHKCFLMNFLNGRDEKEYEKLYSSSLGVLLWDRYVFLMEDGSEGWECI